MPSQHEPTFRAFCEWLRAANLYGKFLTQLGKLVPAGSGSASHTKAARAGALEVLDRLRRVASQSAIDRITADLAGLADLRERLEADSKTALLQRSDRLRRPVQILDSVIGKLKLVPSAIRDLTNARYESGERGQSRREADLHKLLFDIGRVRAQLDQLAAGCIGFQLPEQEAAILKPLMEGGRRLEGIAKCCAQARMLEGEALAEALGALAQDAAQAGGDAALVAQCNRAFAGLISQSVAEAALAQGWEVSLRAWERREILGVDPRLGFIFCLSTRFRDPASQARYHGWLEAHETGSPTGDTPGRRVLRAVVAMCCTLYRWGEEQHQLNSVRNLVAIAFDQQSDRLFRPPPGWSDVLDTGKKIRLRSFYDLTSGISKDPNSLPRFGAYRLAILEAGDRRQIADTAVGVLARAEYTWAVALASKLGFFEDGVRNEDEPRVHGRAALGPLVVRRIHRIASHVRRGTKGLSRIESHAARIFAQAEGPDSFSSTAYGTTRRDSWMYGARFEAIVLEASGIEAGDGRNELDLFCRPLTGNVVDVWRIWQMLLHLRDRVGRFRTALWAPMTSASTTTEDMETYFRLEQHA